MQISIRGPLVILSAKNQKPLSSPVKLRKLNRLVSEDSCVNYLTGKLSDLDLQDGHIRLRFDAKSGEMEVLTNYQSERELTKKELTALTSETIGQWTDGIGEGEFDAFENEHSMVFELLSEGAKAVRAEQISEADAKKKTVRRRIFGAIKKGDLEAVAKCLDSGEDIEARKENATPLINATSEGQAKVVQLLVERGADVHARDEEGETALYHCAVIRTEHLSDAKATEIAKILLAAGADPNAVDKDGTTHPLELAKSRKKKKLCQALEAAGSRYFEVEVPVQTAAKKPAKIDCFRTCDGYDGGRMLDWKAKGKLKLEAWPGVFHLQFEDQAGTNVKVKVSKTGSVSPKTITLKG